MTGQSLMLMSRVSRREFRYIKARAPEVVGWPIIWAAGLGVYPTPRADIVVTPKFDNGTLVKGFDFQK
jgi:hypothetical protein